MFANLDPAAPSPTDPAQLATITVPVLVLQGERTALPWFTRGNRHLAEHVPDCEVRTIPGVGHGGPGLAPEAIARELVRFLQSEHEPA